MFATPSGGPSSALPTPAPGPLRAPVVPVAGRGRGRGGAGAAGLRAGRGRTPDLGAGSRPSRPWGRGPRPDPAPPPVYPRPPPTRSSQSSPLWEAKVHKEAKRRNAIPKGRKKHDPPNRRVFTPPPQTQSLELELGPRRSPSARDLHERVGGSNRDDV